jgi:hypothetical protein
MDPASQFQGSKKFELQTPQRSDPMCDPVNIATSTTELGVTVARGETQNRVHDVCQLPKQVLLGPGKVFRPTPGLCALFRRTGTRNTRKPLALPQPPEKLTKKSYADVVRGGRAMADNNTGFGGRGFGRLGGGFHPGFNSGFNPGSGGRGGGRGRHPPRGRGRDRGGGNNYGGNNGVAHNYGGGRGFGGQRGYEGRGGRGGWQSGYQHPRHPGPQTQHSVTRAVGGYPAFGGQHHAVGGFLRPPRWRGSKHSLGGPFHIKLVVCHQLRRREAAINSRQPHTRW